MFYLLYQLSLRICGIKNQNKVCQYSYQQIVKNCRKKIFVKTENWLMCKERGILRTGIKPTYMMESFPARVNPPHCTKMKFSINDFISKCDQIRMKLWIWSY